MKYTESQIKKAKSNYFYFLRKQTVQDNDPEIIGIVEAQRRTEYHNNIVDQINSGNKEVEREWKLFFLMEEVKKDHKKAESKAKLNANKSTSANILSPIKEMRKLGDFGKWLNTSGNPFRKQHFNKKYTVEAVNTFLSTL